MSKYTVGILQLPNNSECLYLYKPLLARILYCLKCMRIEYVINYVIFVKDQYKFDIVIIVIYSFIYLCVLAWIGCQLCVRLYVGGQGENYSYL